MGQFSVGVNTALLEHFPCARVGFIWFLAVHRQTRNSALGAGRHYRAASVPAAISPEQLRLRYSGKIHLRKVGQKPDGVL